MLFFVINSQEDAMFFLSVCDVCLASWYGEDSHMWDICSVFSYSISKLHSYQGNLYLIQQEFCALHIRKIDWVL